MVHLSADLSLSTSDPPKQIFPIPNPSNEYMQHDLFKLQYILLISLLKFKFEKNEIKKQNTILNIKYSISIAY